MSRTTPLREEVLHAVREERTRQDQKYAHRNVDLAMGFGGSVSPYPWLFPYSDADSGSIESAFRADYEQYADTHGEPTWMHLIREEVAELFATQNRDDTVTEAIQVAALCVSLVEHLTQGGVS